jgi:hypothetical protein
METILEMLNKFDLTTIVAMFIISWYHTHELRKEIRADFQEQSNQLDKQSTRSDRLYEMFIDLLKERK